MGWRLPPNTAPLPIKTDRRPDFCRFSSPCFPEPVSNFAGVPERTRSRWRLVEALEHNPCPRPRLERGQSTDIPPMKLFVLVHILVLFLVLILFLILVLFLLLVLFLFFVLVLFLILLPRAGQSVKVC